MDIVFAIIDYFFMKNIVIFVLIMAVLVQFQLKIIHEKDHNSDAYNASVSAGV